MPFGFRPVGTIDGGPYTGDQERFLIANAYTTPIYYGDPVKRSAGNIIRGVAAQSIYGIFLGCEYVDPMGKKTFSNFWPGLTGCTEIRATVIYNPDALYEVETAAGAGNIVQAYKGARVDLALGTGNAATGVSGATVGAAIATGGFEVQRVVDSPGNELGAASRRVHVVAVSHELRPYVTL